jgi:hypothetical protein
MHIPDNFGEITKVTLHGIIDPSTAGAGKDIDFYADWGQVGEAYNAHSASDTTTIWDLTGTADQLYAFDITHLFAPGTLNPEDSVGIEVDHNGVGNSIYYTGVELEYITA